MVLEEVAPRFAGRITIARVDVDSNSELAEAHSVGRVPTLLIFARERIVRRIQGRISRDDLVAVLEELVTPNRQKGL